MMHDLASRLGHAIALTALAVCLAPVAFAQQIQFQQSEIRGPNQPPRTGTGTIKGRVLDGISGAPVVRARVRVSGGGGQRPPVTTDGTGTFVFGALPAGTFTIAVDKTGFQTASYPDRGRTMRSTATPLALRDGEILEGIAIRLYRYSVIAGRIVDANGDPVEGASVRALKTGAAGARVVNTTSTMANDLGEYRLSRLDAGSYVIMATADRLSGSMMDIGPDGLQKPGSRLAPTYFPNVAAVEQAQQVVAQRGQTTSGVDLVMGEETWAVITGTVVDPQGQPAGRDANIEIHSVSRNGLGGGGSGTNLRPDGSFRALVTPGEYRISVTVAASSDPSMLSRTPPALFGSELVTVASGATETVTMTLGKGATASGRIIFEGSSPPPRNAGQVGVQLMSPEGRWCTSNPAQIAPDWSFKIEGLTGTCKNGGSTGAGRWLLKSVLYEGEDLADRTITFKPGHEYRDVQVVFTDRPSDVTFRVHDGGVTTREYVAILLPADPALWPRDNSGPGPRTLVPPSAETLAAMAQAQASGNPASPMVANMRRETIGALRPGEYLAIAVDNIEYDDLRDAKVLEKLAARATKVTVPSRGSIEVALGRLKIEDVLR